MSDMPHSADRVQLRTRLLENYESILLRDIKFATQHKVEGALWKRCFYRFIDEFRRKIFEVCLWVYVYGSKGMLVRLCKGWLLLLKNC